MKNHVRILAVEDETAVARLLALVLCGPACKVVTACDGAEALEKIATSAQPFDVVITDHQMPKATGLELVRQLRRDEFGGKIAVLSAHLNEENTRAYEKLGVDLMLSKPFDIDELRHAVEVLADEPPALVEHPEYELRQGVG
jgi:CheY-like chemotaxis protein